MNDARPIETAVTRPCVLFVDDEPRILTALQVIFRKDYEVVTASGGAAAIAVLRNREVDVVCSDQRMPGVTGVEVLRAARELRPRAMRLLLTGYSDLQAIVGSVNEGEVFRFITKPWVNGELRASLAAAIQASGSEYVALTAPERAAERARGVAVLVLDDDRDVHAEIGRLLGNGHPVYGADSVEEGASLMRQHEIGILITELAVNGRYAAEFLPTLRQPGTSRVAVVLTAQADATRFVDLINQGQIYRLLQKPINEKLLRGTVNLASRRCEALSPHAHVESFAPRPAAAAPAVTASSAAAAAPASPIGKPGLFARFGRLFGFG